jgi:hyperosmotically inducible protein
VQQDRQIVTAVRNRLSADAVTKGLSIGVDTYQGVVTLRGSVDKAEQRSAAERIARGISGVRNVQNELRVR